MIKYRTYGFSLMEVLLAIGVLAIGLLFVAGTFPVGIFLTTSATEQTIAPSVADEAFAKVRLYSIADSNSAGLMLKELRFKASSDTVSSIEDFNKGAHLNFVHDYETIIDKADTLHKFHTSEQLYPSILNSKESYYQWSALLRKTIKVSDANTSIPVQVTVFVCRKASDSLRYPAIDAGTAVYDWPRPVRIKVTQTNSNERILDVGGPDDRLVVDDMTIMDDATGEIYRVTYVADSNPSTTTGKEITLDKVWRGDSPSTIWVVPPAVGGSKSPCVGVFQRIMKF